MTRRRCAPGNPRRPVRPWLLLPALAVAACGKKAPPLMPLPTVPQQVTELTARRLNDEVYIRFKIPTTNVTGEKPADVRSVVVYGFTGQPPEDEEFIKYGTLVAEVPVRKPPPPPPPAKKGEPPPPPPPPPTGPGLNQGDYAVVVERVTPQSSVPIVTKAERERLKKAKPAPPSRGPLLGPPGRVALRTYVVVGLDHRGHKGRYSTRVAVPLLEPPPAPAAPTVTYTATAFTVGWVRPLGARIAVLEAPAAPNDAPAPAGPAPSAAPATSTPPEATSTPSADVPAGVPPAPAAQLAVLPSRPLFPVVPASLYNVYQIVRVKPPDASAASPGQAAATPAPPGSPPAPGSLESPLPLNPQPIAGESFRDTRLEFGTERCYAVRTVNALGGVGVESALSEVTCTVPADTFAPAAPRGLAAVGSESAIDLIWEPNSESDLAGYLVLRGAPGDETLQRLTPEPIRPTTYRDSSVRRGVRYAYVVVAVDKAANLSLPSERVEETAR